MDFSLVFQALEQCEASLSDMILALLNEARFKKSPLTAELLNRAGDLVYALLKHKKTSMEVPKRASEALHVVYAAEIEHLVDIKSEWHFSALRALPQDIDGFQMQELAADIDRKAPMLSALLSVLLSARKRHHASESLAQADLVATTPDADEEELLLEGQTRTPSSPEELHSEKRRQKERVLAIVRLTLL
jgi:hypothetical protein